MSHILPEPCKIIMDDSKYPILHFNGHGHARVMKIENKSDHKFLINMFNYLNDEIQFQKIQINYLNQIITSKQ